MNSIRWGIIGPGNIANNFADGLKESKSGNLIAIASTNKDRRKRFGDKYNINSSMRFHKYEEIINSPMVDAIYISTPHTFHAEWTIKAAEKGKHVLCEKPAAVNYKEAIKVIESVKKNKIFYMEGLMYKCHPQISTLLKLIKEKKIGDVKFIKSSFGFDTGKTIHESRLFRTDLAGGAILDVGLYPISFSRFIAGASLGKKFANPIKITGRATIGETLVDEKSYAILQFENNIIAEVSSSIREKMKNNAIIEGTNGMIEMDQPWDPGRDGGPYHSTLKIVMNDQIEIIEFKGSEHLFSFEIEFANKAILQEKTEVSYPGMSWEDTLGNLKCLDEWRKSIGYSLPQD